MSERRTGIRSVFANQRFAFDVGIVMLVGFAITLFRLGNQSLWLDEGVSVMRLSEGTLIDVVAGIFSIEFNFGLYHVALWFWKGFAETEAQIRGLSVVFFVGSIALTYVLAIRLFGRFEALLASSFIAVHGFLVEWAQTARGYTMFLFLVLLSSIAFLSVAEGKRWSGIVYGLSFCAALATHVFAWFTLAGHLVSLPLISNDRRKVSRQLLQGLPIILGFTMVALLAIWNGEQGFSQADWIPPISVDRLQIAGVDVLAGSRLPAVLVAIVLIFASGAKLGTKSERDLAVEDRGFFAVSVWAATPILGTIAVSLLVRPLLVSYYWIGVVPFIFIALAHAIRGLRFMQLRWLLSALVAAALVVSTAEWLNRSSREDFRGIAETLETNMAPGDSLAIYPEYLRWSLGYYYPLALEENNDRIILIYEKELIDSFSDIPSRGSAWVLTRRNFDRLIDRQKPVAGDSGTALRLYRAE